MNHSFLKHTIFSKTGHQFIHKIRNISHNIVYLTYSGVLSFSNKNLCRDVFIINYALYEDRAKAFKIGYLKYIFRFYTKLIYAIKNGTKAPSVPICLFTILKISPLYTPTSWNQT